MGEGGAGFNMANAYNMNRASKGYIGEYDFALSGNIRDRVYLGLTVGLQDVHYKGYSEYTESLIGGGQHIGNITVCDERKITGTGYNFRVGAIFRPIEDSASASASRSPHPRSTTSPPATIPIWLTTHRSRAPLTPTTGPATPTTSASTRP